MEATASGGYFPAIVSIDDGVATQEDDNFGLFLEVEEEYDIPLNDAPQDKIACEESLAAALLAKSSLSPEAREPSGSGQLLQPVVSAALQTKKSALKTISSYGSLEPLCDNIPISVKKSAWKTLPAPCVPLQRRRVQSTGCFFQQNLDELAETDNQDSEQGNPAITTMKRNVSFGNIQIRGYDFTIGDSPSCLYGTPISLDWNYHQEEPVCMELYEIDRPRRRSMRQMHLNSYQRKQILSLRFSAAEIKQAKKEAARLRWQRDITKTCLPFQKLEDFVESAVRKTKRVVGTKSTRGGSSVNKGESSSTTTSIGRSTSTCSLGGLSVATV